MQEIILLTLEGIEDYKDVLCRHVEIKSQFCTTSFFDIETYKAAVCARDCAVPLIGIFKNISQESLKGFCDKAIENITNNAPNLYYYPKPHEFFQADDVAVFMIYRDYHLEKYLIEMLYRVKQMPVSTRNGIHGYLTQNLMPHLALRQRSRITREGRELSNLSANWEQFNAPTQKDDLLNGVRAFYPAPIHINLGTINRCNLKCSFCFFFAPEYVKTHTTDFFKDYKALDTRIVHGVLDYAAQHGCIVDLVGPCEMLVDKRIPDFIAYGKKQGVKYISMTTNGLLLDEEMSHRIMQSGLDSLSISIDAATEETYSQTRGGNFNKLVKNIEYFLSELENRGVKMFISLSMILNKGAHQEVELFKQKWSAYKAVNEFYIRNLIEKENEGKEVYHNDNFKFKERLVCQKMWDEVHINPDGGVMPCCTMAANVGWDNTVLGNLYEHSMDEIWNGEVARSLRIELLNGRFDKWKVCSSCKEWSYVQIEQDNGDVISPSISFLKVNG